MEHPITGVWPNGMETSFWNYDKLSPERTEVSDLPLLAISLSTDFAIAFVFGAVLIAFFAFDRFNRRSFEPDSLDYRVLKEVAPMELRARDLMMRAYILYVSALLGIYVALTFFGQIIFELWNPIATAGFQFDKSPVDFDSPQWPLLVSFGMAGVLPMIKPLDAVEGSLRRWSHKSVGIPIKVRENTTRLKRTLTEYLNDQRGALAGSVDERAPKWLETHVTDRSAIERAYESRDLVACLLGWMMVERTYWPGTDVRAKLLHLETDAIKEAQVAVEDFDELMEQDYDKAPTPTSYSKSLPDQDRLLLHRKRLDRHWEQLNERLDRLSDELSAILAVYIERDQRYEEISDPNLEKLVRICASRSEIQRGPEFWIGSSLVAILIVYALSITFGFHSLLANVQKTPINILFTAGLETAQIAFLFWIPVVVASGLRYFERERENWELITIAGLTPTMMTQIFFALVAGGIVAFVGSIGLAAFWSALIAPNQDEFKRIFLTNDPSFFGISATLCGVSVIQICLVILATDAKRLSGSLSRRRLIGFGVINMVLILSYYFVYLRQWQPVSCTGAEWYMSDVFDVWPYCARYYTLTTFLVIGVVAFLSATFFIPKRIGSDPRRVPVPPPGHRGATSTAASVVAAVCVLAFTPGAFAESDRLGTVRLGFRADAEPFSFRVGDGEKARFTGYIADFCYKIFAGGPYPLISREVTASNRFDLLRPAGADVNAPNYLDVICDPVTLRFSSGDKRTNGIFSPIIFASGVSYLKRSDGSGLGDVLIGYVGNTTSREVAQRICQIDFFEQFRSDGDGQQDGADEAEEETTVNETFDCMSAEQQARENNFFETNCLNLKPKNEKNGGASLGSNTPSAYKFCIGPSHSVLIEWFCQDLGNSPETLVYVGDRDIIIGKKEARTAQNLRCGGRYERGETYTYEPYALVLTAARPKLAQFVQRRIYEIFSKPEEAIALFSAHFPNKVMSRPLASLFLLNAVEEADRFRRSSGSGLKE